MKSKKFKNKRSVLIILFDINILFLNKMNEIN